MASIEPSTTAPRKSFIDLNKVGGFLTGALLCLVLAGVVSVSYSGGGLGDRPTVREPAYIP